VKVHRVWRSTNVCNQNHFQGGLIIISLLLFSLFIPSLAIGIEIYNGRIRTASSIFRMPRPRLVLTEKRYFLKMSRPQIQQPPQRSIPLDQRAESQQRKEPTATSRSSCMLPPGVAIAGKPGNIFNPCGWIWSSMTLKEIHPREKRC